MQRNSISEIDNLTICQRYLPHWQANEATYFVTWRLQTVAGILSDEERSIVADAIEYFDNQRYTLAAYVVMDDHVHVLVRPSNTQTLSKTVHSWKSFTGHAIQKRRNRTGSLWLQESFDRIVRDTEELDKFKAYIANNPTNRWPETSVYLWYKVFDM